MYWQFWGQTGTFSLQGLIDGVGLFQQPTWKKLACYLAGQAVADGGGALVPRAERVGRPAARVITHLVVSSVQF